MGDTLDQIDPELLAANLSAPMGCNIALTAGLKCLADQDEDEKE
jgi:hypothetical protein